jgi:8-oxo-dGTP pyrophosphatase MutT (NUDIX family)
LKKHRLSETKLIKILNEKLPCVNINLNPAVENIESNARPAAVLIPIFAQENNWKVLFTRRNGYLKKHSGQVAFPGGAWEIGDQDLKVTALRETEEEIGILREDVKPLGCLPARLLVSGYSVTPIIGLIPYPYPFRILQNEVEEIFSIPLDWLCDPQHYYQKEVFYQGVSYHVTNYVPYHGNVLWGASASMILELLEILQTVIC